MALSSGPDVLDQQAYDLGIVDHMGRYKHVPMFGRRSAATYLPSVPKQKTCRDCGKTGLRWGQVKGSVWRLFDGNAEHVCAYKLNPNV